MELDKNHTETDIEDRLNFSFNKLDSGTGNSEYGTGYLATMYLGYLIGGNEVNANSIAKGVYALLNTVRGGASLDKAINDLTKYDGYQDFFNQFAKDASPFIRELLNTVENGTGSLITGNLKNSDLLQNGTVADSSVSKLFELNTNASIVVNDYFWNHPDHVMIEGGSLYVSGAEGTDYIPSDAGNNNGTDLDGDDPVDPDIGGDGTTNSGNIASVNALHSGIRLHIGANASIENSMIIHLTGVSSDILGVSQVDISTRTGAEQAIDIIQKAVDIVSSQRTDIGVYQNRLEHSVRNLENIVENTIMAESRIRDTDMATAMVEYSKLHILEQATSALLSQANSQPEYILKLLG